MSRFWLWVSQVHGGSSILPLHISVILPQLLALAEDFVPVGVPDDPRTADEPGDAGARAAGAHQSGRALLRRRLPPARAARGQAGLDHLWPASPGGCHPPLMCHSPCNPPDVLPKC